MIDDRNSKVISNVVLENREKLTVSGVLDVASFDDENVALETELGALMVRGADFRINKLNVDIGELVIEGQIDSLFYGDGYSKNKGGFFSRMFK